MSQRFFNGHRSRVKVCHMEIYRVKVYGRKRAAPPSNHRITRRESTIEIFLEHTRFNQPDHRPH
ncbi:MAG: hypothetical protein M3R15_31015 [Acidobacteriota bacterium]|nr:hypothetical protein [Acidobacteriota bacterium]